MSAASERIDDSKILDITTFSNRLKVKTFRFDNCTNVIQFIYARRGGWRDEFSRSRIVRRFPPYGLKNIVFRHGVLLAFRCGLKVVRRNDCLGPPARIRHAMTRAFAVAVVTAVNTCNRTHTHTYICKYRHTSDVQTHITFVCRGGGGDEAKAG